MHTCQGQTKRSTADIFFVILTKYYISNNLPVQAPESHICEWAMTQESQQDVFYNFKSNCRCFSASLNKVFWMNKREGGTIHRCSKGRRFFFFFPPSSYKECECVGEQHKSRPHLHLLGTRDWYLNNDKQPTPHSFTAAIERHFFFWCGFCLHCVRISICRWGRWNHRSKEAIWDLQMWSGPSKCTLVREFTMT